MHDICGCVGGNVVTSCSVPLEFPCWLWVWYSFAFFPVYCSLDALALAGIFLSAGKVKKMFPDICV